MLNCEKINTEAGSCLVHSFVSLAVCVFPLCIILHGHIVYTECCLYCIWFDIYLCDFHETVQESEKSNQAPTMSSFRAIFEGMIVS